MVVAVESNQLKYRPRLQLLQPCAIIRWLLFLPQNKITLAAFILLHWICVCCGNPASNHVETTKIAPSKRSLIGFGGFEDGGWSNDWNQLMNPWNTPRAPTHQTWYAATTRGSNIKQTRTHLKIIITPRLLVLTPGLLISPCPRKWKSPRLSQLQNRRPKMF